MSLGSTTKYISLLPSNGTEFTSEQKVQFDIKPNISFVKGRDSYLSFDVHNPTQVPANFYNTAGASSVIDRMDIYSLSNGQLLESLTNYSMWSNIENQYLTRDSAQKVIKEGCTENLRVYSASGYTEATGVQTHNPNRLEEGQSGATKLFTIDNTGNKKGVAQKYCIALKSGVFNHFGVEEKLTPVLLLGGLRIEITLNKDVQVLSRMVMKDGADSRTMTDPVAANNNCFRIQDSGGNVNNLTSTEDQADPQQCGWTVGARIRILSDNGGGQDIERNITVIAITGGKLVITVDGAAFNLSTNVRCVHPVDVEPTYQLTNVELKLCEIVPPREMLKAVIKESQYDFISYETFLDNLPATSLNHNVDMPSITERAKAVFTHYINNTSENDKFAPNSYVGNGPSETNLNSVQYFFNNKLYPLRHYNPSKNADRIVSYNETVKAFSAIGKVVQRLGDSAGSEMCDYNLTHTTARELARGQDFVFSLKDAEGQLRLGFSGARAFNTKLISYVFSIRSIMISQNALEVVM